MKKLKEWAKKLKNNINLLCRVYMHKRTPWYAKILIAAVIAYAWSPIDLIPDFIPILGYLDDLILIPGGIALSFKLIPKDVIEECRNSNIEYDLKSKGIIGAVAILLIWVIIVYMVARKIFG